MRYNRSEQEWRSESMPVDFAREASWWDAKAHLDRSPTMLGLGSLAGLVGSAAVATAKADAALFESFLDLCERFDREIMPDGPGTRQRAGVIVAAEREWERLWSERL